MASSPSHNRILQLILATSLSVSAAQAAEPAKKPEATASRAPSVIAEPAPGLDPVTLYQYLLAEIAAARGELGVASQAYMELVRRHRIPFFARRATELAVQARQGQWAIEAAQVWVDAEPDSVPALQTLALLQSSGNGKPQDVERTLARLFAHSSEARLNLLPQLQRIYANVPDTAQVLSSVMRLTEPYLNMPEAHLARSQAYLADGQRAKSEGSARQALSLRPGWERAALQVAQTRAGEDESAAMEELGVFGRQYPQARSARSGYLRWLVGKGRKDDARAEYQRLLADFPSDEDVAFVALQAAVAQADHATAEPLIRRLIASGHPESNLLRIQLGQELEAGGRNDEARAIYDSVPPGRDYLAARSALANLLARQGRLDEGRRVLQDAAAVEPDRATSYVIAESGLLLKQARAADAYALLERALQKNPDESDLLYEAGMVAERTNRLDLMETHLRKLIRLKPDHAHAYNALGYTFADRNIRLDEAESLLLRALSLASDDAAILDSVGWLYFRKGQFAQAIEYLQKSYAKLQDDEVAAHLVEALWAAGRKDEAMRLLEKARQARPKSELLDKLEARLVR